MLPAKLCLKGGGEGETGQRGRRSIGAAGVEVSQLCPRGREAASSVVRFGVDATCPPYAMAWHWAGFALLLHFSGKRAGISLSSGERSMGWEMKRLVCKVPRQSCCWALWYHARTHQPCKVTC